MAEDRSITISGPAPGEPPIPGEPPVPGGLIPLWLAVLVLVLLLAVMGVGGYVIRGVVAGEQPAPSLQEAEVAKWREQVRESPQDTASHLGLGYAYQNAGRYDKALEEYATVLEFEPSDTAALYNQGIVYQKLGVGATAERSFWKVLAIEPGHALAAKALGEQYVGKKQYRSAIKAVEPAAEANPEMSDLQYLMGFALENLGVTDSAVERYRLALKYTPDMQQAIEGLKRLGVTP